MAQQFSGITDSVMPENCCAKFYMLI